MASLAAGYGVLFTIVDDYKNEYGISAGAVGLIIGIGFFAGFLSQLLVAPLADRGHARAVVFAGVAVAVLGLVLMASGTTLTTILLGRFINGFGIGAANPAVRRIVILADPSNLGQNLGWLLSAEVFGFAMGPVVSAIMVPAFGIAAPFYAIAATTIVLALSVSRVKVTESTDAPRQKLALDLLRIRPFAGAVIMATAVYIMIGAFDALWALVHDELGTSEWIANLGIALFALPLIFLGPAGGRLAQRVGPFRLGSVGLVLGAAFMASYGILPTGGLIFAVAMVHALSDGITISSTGVAVGMVVPEERQAGAQGILGAAQALMAGIMAAATGGIYEQFGRTAAYMVCAIVMLLLVGSGLWLARSAWNLRGDESVVDLEEFPEPLPDAVSDL